MITPQEIKKYRKSDFTYLIGPLLALFAFIAIAAFIFPKPARIYREGTLRECKCGGVMATPKGTNAIGVGDSYCLGMPYDCKDLQIIKDKQDE